VKRKQFLLSALGCAPAITLMAGRNTFFQHHKKIEGQLRIDSIRLTTGKGPCKLRFSYGKVNEYPFGLIRIRSGKYEGIGEGHIIDFEAFKTAAKQLIGADALQLDNLVSKQWFPAIGEAISIALHDLVAKASGIPFHVLLGGAVRKQVPVMPCIFPENTNDAALKAGQFSQQGFEGVKFKFVGEAKEDLANLKAIRKALPEKMFIIADANRGYKDVKAFYEHLPEFASAGLSIAEDPIDGNYENYAYMRGKTDAKIMVDIKVRSEETLRLALAAGAADIINLHPNQQGSLSRAIARAKASEIMGCKVWIGGTGSFGVQAAAYQQLASVIGTSMPCGEVGGLFDHGFVNDIIEKPYELKNGAVTLPDEAGLGIRLDEKAIKEMQTADEELR
jgi:L-alanine-DL-glutamate epimerase-like enolase superfamily enzyme